MNFEFLSITCVTQLVPFFGGPPNLKSFLKNTVSRTSNQASQLKKQENSRKKLTKVCIRLLWATRLSKLRINDLNHKINCLVQF
jgi:hypothetical protein